MLPDKKLWTFYPVMTAIASDLIGHDQGPSIDFTKKRPFPAKSRPSPTVMGLTVGC
jgi:hypothetical protein